MNHGNRPFSVLLPKAPDYGDAIILRGKLKPNATKWDCLFIQCNRNCAFLSVRIVLHRFSFNLCVDVCPCPEVVAFHFKTMLDSNTVVHNHKDITWQQETVSANTWVDGPGEPMPICNIKTTKMWLYFLSMPWRCWIYHSTGADTRPCSRLRRADAALPAGAQVRYSGSEDAAGVGWRGVHQRVYL